MKDVLFSLIVVRYCVCMGGCMCLASFFLFIRSFTVWTQDVFVAGREGPGARGPRSPSSKETKCILYSLYMK